MPFFPVGKKIWVLEWIAELKLDLTFPRTVARGWGGGGTLGISGWECAAGTLEPLTYTRASSAEFCYPILE